MRSNSLLNGESGLGAGGVRFSPLPIRVLLAQLRFEQLAGGGMGQLVDEDKVIGKLPFGELCAQEFAKLFRLRAGAVFQSYDGQRTLLPFWMKGCDHRRFADGAVAHDRVLKVGGADPFSTGLDHVFAAVHDLDAALRVDGGDVTGAEPALFGPALAGLRRVVIAGSDPRSAHLEFAGGLADVRGHSVGRADAEADDRQ